MVSRVCPCLRGRQCATSNHHPAARRPLPTAILIALGHLLSRSKSGNDWSLHLGSFLSCRVLSRLVPCIRWQSGLANWAVRAMTSAPADDSRRRTHGTHRSAELRFASPDCSLSFPPSLFGKATFSTMDLSSSSPVGHSGPHCAIIYCFIKI